MRASDTLSSGPIRYCARICPGVLAASQAAASADLPALAVPQTGRGPVNREGPRDARHA